MDEQVCVIMEQGDLGLFGDPLSESDQELYKKQAADKQQDSNENKE